jgi:hypothetical protein
LPYKIKLHDEKLVPILLDWKILNNITVTLDKPYNDY